MRIKTKLIIAFLIIGILPMLAALYVSINLIEKRLNEVNQQRLKDSRDLVQDRQQDTFHRTSFAAQHLAEDKNIQEDLVNHDYLDLRDRMDSFGKTLIKIGYPVKQIEFLFPEDLQIFAKNSTDLFTKDNPIWQGFAFTSTEHNETGIMASSVWKVEYQNQILGGFQVGIFVQPSMVDVIRDFYPEVQASILYPNFPYDKDDKENERLHKTVFEEGKTFSSVSIERAHVPFLAQCLPLKGLNDKVIAGIFIGTPQSSVIEVWAPFRDQLYIVMIAIAGVLAIILGYIIARGMASPIRKLLKGAGQIAQGNLNYRIRVRSKDEMKDLADAFNSMADKLKETREMEFQLHRQDKLASLGQLSAGIAHEIRNPLGIMKTSAGILKDKFPDSSKEKEAVQYIIDEVNHLNTFITDFLNFAKPREPKIVPTHAREILERTIKLAQTQYPQEKYPIEYPSHSTDGTIAVDPQQIQQVFLNLILNACQSMPDGGHLKIGLIQNNSKKMLGIAFQDEGNGISEEDKKKIFDPFFTTRQDGTGLGLSVVNQIVEQHKGKIEVYSEQGHGTRITVYLPLVEEKK